MASQTRKISDEKPLLPGLVTDHQMKALEYCISRSRDATDYAKKAIIWSLHQTNNLARSIAVSFLDEWDKEKAKEIADSVHDMRSAGGSTHIQTIFEAMYIKRSISFHCGYYLNGQFTPMAPGYTIWVAERMYDHTANRLEPDFAAIEAVDLSWNSILGQDFWTSRQ